MERENGADVLAGTTTRVCQRFGLVYDKRYIDFCLPFIMAGFSERDCFLVSCAFIKRYAGFTFMKSVDCMPLFWRYFTFTFLALEFTFL